MTLTSKLARFQSIFKKDNDASSAITQETMQATPSKPEGPLNLIIFIGHHKVGSTSLQDFLARNHVALAREGILYPFVETEGLSYAASLASGHAGIEGNLPINIREPHNALAFKMMAEATKREVPSYHENLPSKRQMLVAIKNQIRFSEPHTVILAAEVFANFNATEPRLIKNLLSQFPKANVTLVATLRRIDEYIASWHGQRLKFGHELPRLSADGLKAYRNSIHFDYKLMLEGWVTAAPNAKLILRDYADVMKNGGSVSDFFSQTGLQIPQNIEPERRVNDSLHRATYEIARRGNLELNPSKAKALRKVLRKVPTELDLPPSNEIELFGPERRKQIAHDFLDIDRYLGRLTNKAEFFPDPSAVLTVLQFDEIECNQQVLNYLINNDEICPIPEIQEFLNYTKSNF